MKKSAGKFPPIFKICNLLKFVIVLGVRRVRDMSKQMPARGDLVDEIIGKYSATVFRVAFIHTKSRADADDIFQEVFIKLFRANVLFKSDEHIKAWLIRVTTNASLDFLKSAWNKKTVELSNELPTEDEHDFDTRNLTRLVKSLPSKYRAVVFLYYYEDLSVEEIAKTLKSNKNTVKSQLSRARSLLKNKLDGSFADV